MILAVTIFLILLICSSVYIYLSGPKLPPETNEIIENVLTSELPEVVSGKSGFTSSDSLNIWYECISPESPSKGTVLPIMGKQAVLWIGPQNSFKHLLILAIR